MEQDRLALFMDEWQGVIEGRWATDLDADLQEDMERPLDAYDLTSALHLATLAITALAPIYPDRANQMRSVLQAYAL